MNSRDKQQGDPEICREFVTIPMVQEVYGSQPQIRAGIGPTEPVRPMSEPTQESMERTSQLLDRIFTAYYSGKEAKSFRHAFRRDVASMIAMEFDRLRDYVRQQSAPDDLLELAIEMAIAYCNGFSPQIYPEIPKRPTPDDVRKRYTALAEHVDRATAELRAENKELADDYQSLGQERERELNSLKAQLAEAERKARLDEARMWENFHFSGRGPNDELYWNQMRIAALSAPAKDGEKQ